MKISRKTWILLGVFIGLAFTIFFVYKWHMVRKSLPEYESNVKIADLKKKVVVYRDKFAIPHIYAKNETDLYRATGYCMAQDRLWQMDLLRRVTTGRLSEIFGEDLIESDLLFRALKISEKSRLVLKNSDPNLINSLDAFSDGVNQYIKHKTSELPVEFQILDYTPEEWEPIYSVNLIGYMAWSLTMPWHCEIALYKILDKVGDKLYRELIPNIHEYENVVYPKLACKELISEIKDSFLDQSKIVEEMCLPIFFGSNNWAISGSKSATGMPILANDMHLKLSIPGIWYQAHQIIEDGLDVTGVLLPGQPFVVCGHNRYIAWGMTNVMVDDMDFYLERINQDNPYEYLYKSKWHKMDVRKEKIKVKGGEIIEKELLFTRHGPIISKFKGIRDKAISMRWIGYEYSNEVRSIYLLNRAKDWNDFKNAVKTFFSVSQNIIYADIMGNIGLYCCAGIPIRENGSGFGIMPGWTDDFEWKGFVPFEKMPYVYNPPSGYVSSANNKTTSSKYPYISLWFDLPYRIERIRELLTSKEKLSIDDFIEMQTDQKSKLVEKMLGDILAILKRETTLSKLEEEALHILENWDMTEKVNSSAASIFEKFYMTFVKNTFSDELGDELFNEYIKLRILANYAIDRLWEMKESDWFDDISTKDMKEKFPNIVINSFKESIAWLDDRFGPNPKSWEWGEIHQLTLRHPLGIIKTLDVLFNFNRGPFPVGGSFHTICPYEFPLNTEFKINFGASQRHIFDLSNWDNSLTVLPTGESGIPCSDYYCDQTKLYIKNRYHHDFVSRDKVEKNAQYKMIMTKD